MSQNGQQQEAETKVARWIQSSLISIKTSYFVLHISWGEGCCWRCSGDPALYYTTFTPPSIGFLKAGKLATKRRLTFTFLISRRRVCLLFCSGCFSLHYIQRTLKLVLKSFNHSESDTFSIREPMMKLVRSKTSHVYFISVESCKCTIPVVTFFNIFDFRLLAPTEWCSSAAWTHTDWKVI